MRWPKGWFICEWDWRDVDRSGWDLILHSNSACEWCNFKKSPPPPKKENVGQDRLRRRIIPLTVNKLQRLLKWSWPNSQAIRAEKVKEKITKTYVGESDARLRYKPDTPRPPSPKRQALTPDLHLTYIRFESTQLYRLAFFGHTRRMPRARGPAIGHSSIH
jgi:hypothetical protein